MNAASPGIATFFRVEGVLVRRPALAAPAWLAANAQTFKQRLFGLGTVLAAAPLALPGTPLSDPTTAARLAWAGLRDVSEDRLILLGEAYYQAWLKDAVSAAGTRMWTQAKARGDRLVLVSDSVDVVVQHLADDLGAHDLICNRLQMRRGRATGRLADPILGHHTGGSWLRDYAATHGLDLSRSTACGHGAGDVALLSAVGLPCAVNPDPTLRHAARDLAWPVVVD
ncbi:MAG: HAD-IB family phosphatase [Myxococcota bacterium]